MINSFDSGQQFRLSFDSGQPAQTAQADLNRYFFRYIGPFYFFFHKALLIFITNTTSSVRILQNVINEGQIISLFRLSEKFEICRDNLSFLYERNNTLCNTHLFSVYFSFTQCIHFVCLGFYAVSTVFQLLNGDILQIHVSWTIFNQYLTSPLA